MEIKYILVTKGNQSRFWVIMNFLQLANKGEASSFPTLSPDREMLCIYSLSGDGFHVVRLIKAIGSCLIYGSDHMAICGRGLELPV